MLRRVRETLLALLPLALGLVWTAGLMRSSISSSTWATSSACR
jgi:predicted RND superfamily exporter protein